MAAAPGGGAGGGDPGAAGKAREQRVGACSCGGRLRSCSHEIRSKEVTTAGGRWWRGRVVGVGGR